MTDPITLETVIRTMAQAKMVTRAKEWSEKNPHESVDADWVMDTFMDEHRKAARSIRQFIENYCGVEMQ